MNRLLVLFCFLLIPLSSVAQSEQPGGFSTGGEVVGETTELYVDSGVGELDEAQLFGRRGNRRNQDGPPQPGDESAPDPAEVAPEFVAGEEINEPDNSQNADPLLTQDQWAIIWEIIKLVLALFGGGSIFAGAQVAYRVFQSRKLKGDSFIDIVERVTKVVEEAKVAKQKKDDVLTTIKELTDSVEASDA